MFWLDWLKKALEEKRDAVFIKLQRNEPLPLLLALPGLLDPDGHAVEDLLSLLLQRFVNAAPQEDL